MKKIIWLLISFIFLLPSINALEIEINSSHALLYNLDENKIMYEKNSQDNVAIASITKIMTAIVAIEKITDLDELVTMDKTDFYTLVESNASVAGFRVGEKVSFRDLLYGLLLPSGADAAQALIRLTYQTKDAFVAKMNAKAQELNMLNTHFTNATGLDEEGQKSTLSDVVKMIKYALENPTLKEILSTNSYRTTDGKLTLYSTVKASISQVGDMSYVLGGKTGTTKNAGRALASFSNFDDTNFILVTVGAPQGKTPYNVIDAKTIYEYFLNNYDKKVLLKKDDLILSLDTIDAKEKNINYYASNDIIKYIPIDSNLNNITIDYDGINEVNYKTKVNTKLGTLTISYNNEILTTEDIYLEKELSIDYYEYFKHHPLIILVMGGILLLILMGIIKKIAVY